MSNTGNTDNHSSAETGGMAEEGYGSPIEAPPGLYVKALYDYTSDDHTSLSFRQGDIIQVLNQLETGWWDGVIGDVRGWFPSNYCAVVPGPDAFCDRANLAAELSIESGTEDDYEDDNDDDLDSQGNSRDDLSILPIESMAPATQEEAAYWIPQATADGRLFYYNTLTGYSTMELPLETPTSPHESGPRNQTNIYVPEHTRAPIDLVNRSLGGYEHDYDGSASEAEGESLLFTSNESSSRRRRSGLSDGVSPATSLDSVNPSPVAKLLDSRAPRSAGTQLHSSTSHFGAAATTSLCIRSAPAPVSSSVPRYFLDDATQVPPSWASLVENMRQAIEAYRQAMLAGDRSQFVSRAEDISDHLRMLLAAGSGTTDNHSGNPSIISTNKALYPHFRDMMSKFSKLVLSSHIAAADWPVPDSSKKCLHEAEGVLSGVYGYVNIARQQKGEDIRRLVPGFVSGSTSGGHWQNNNLCDKDPTAFLEHDSGRDLRATPSTALDSALLDRIDDLRKAVVANCRYLDKQLSLKDKIVTSGGHATIGDAVCAACVRILEAFRPWMSHIESIDLAPLGTSLQNPQLADFSLQKQRAYDGVADLVLACQAMSAPLADEWAELRSDALDTRLNDVKVITRQLEQYMSQIGFSLTLLLEQSPLESPGNLPGGKSDVPAPMRMRSESQVRRVPPESIGIPSSYPINGEDLIEQPQRTLDKAQRFFGQPVPREQPIRDVEETPWFLSLDHEGEVFYDTKSEVPQVKCGTLAGLVEQLTRHDKLEPSFKDTFLLTYRSFTTASELFEMLVLRFTLQPPSGLNVTELQSWTEQKQNPIRIRVVSILKSWLETYWMEPNDNANTLLLRRIHAFVTNAVTNTRTPGTTQLLSLIDQRIRGLDTTARRLVPTLSAHTPTPILPKNMKKIKFLDIDPTEFARQLTIIESRLYAKIKPTECLNKTWQKKLGPDEPDPAVNVKALILHSNQLTNWVAEMILTQSDVKRRMVVIKHFVTVAEKCRQMNNYSTLTSIISALGTAPIHRLNRTWSQVSQKTSLTLEAMRKLMASTKNFGEYRETLHLATPPCIPFFGVYLTDLTFIEDGIPSLTPSDLINFSKRYKTAEVIRDIQQYQNTPYQLQPVPELQDYVLSNMQAAGDVHEMYDRSLEVEPREREDEKIARLLSESGFL
ncbi:cell division control protein Cdc25 [Coccidioides immitis RS]|uniref:Class E vacuolar protein-sorting machinery protein HSE1 n=1 Tax=Coccidioides immitis (strain RS) TaxID=246410 RepID=J3K2J4_COCIM|nr:cell division control protein Cdc25 [Coccidioides immitis RS]EAS28314.3 cell division control protein Cdc25 [Coccidioides immitis RS]